MISNENIKSKALQIRYLLTDVDGTLTNGKVFYDIHGETLKQFSLRDGTGFFLLKKCGIKTGIITGEESPIVRQRAAKLNVDVLLMNAVPKVSVLRNFISHEGVSFDEIAYIGDDINDVNLLQQCGLSFAVADASAMAKSAADIILESTGGNGAFREATEILLSLRDVNIEDLVKMCL